MKISKLIIAVFAVFAMVSCKKEATEPKVVTVDHTEVVSESKTVAENVELTKAEFNIEGMSCAVGCAQKIEKSLAKMDGVAAAKVDFDAKTAVVSYDASKVNTDLLAERVVKTGDQFKVMNMQVASSAKKCGEDCAKACCSKEAKKECKKECEKKCCTADTEKAACAKDCEKACCAKA